MMKLSISFVYAFVSVIGLLIMLNATESWSDQQHSRQYNKVLLKSLNDLLDLLNVPHKSSFDDIICASQVWRRRPGQERWEVPDLDISQDSRKKAFQLLKEIGMVKEILPAQNHYEYALLLGATIPRMQRRLKDLSKLWKNGVRFEKLIFLVGQRPLISKVDQIPELLEQLKKQKIAEELWPKTETEGAKMLHLVMSIPEDMKRVPVSFVDTPRLWMENGWQRPNTRDTLKQWMATSPAPGKTLVISDQPNSHYQREVVRQELPASFYIDLAAHQGDSHAHLALYLDALALWLHNI